MQLSAQKQTLAGLLGGMGHQLVVPPYQRPYAWQREQVDDLWDDLLDALDSGHFMGSIVLNSEHEDRPQVIDGQQRLTTLLLLVSLIQKHFIARNAAARAEPLYQLLYADAFADGDERFRLRTGDANWATFRDYVLRRHDDEQRKWWADFGGEDRATRSRNKELYENARHLDDKIESWLGELDDHAAIERLVHLQTALVRQLEFVVVSVGSAPDAFLLFETLNDRGLQLSQGDLLKNHLLSRVAAKSHSESAVEEAADEWDGLLEDLGPKVDLTRFLRHYLLARSFPVKSDQVFDRFKAQVAASGPGQTLSELRTFGRLYGKLADPARVEGDPEMQAQFQSLNVLRAELCFPVLLMAMSFLERERVLDFARAAEVLTYRYSSVCGLDAKELQLGYHRAAKLLLESKGEQHEEARQQIVQMIPGSDQFVAAFQRQRMGAQYLARYTLQRIESALNPGKEFKSNSLVHIEHVMPQTPSDEWKEILGAEHLLDHPALVQRWGNLTPLHAPLNQGASNKTFAEKQVHYQDSEVALSKDLCNCLRWGLDVIEQRQQWMAELADSIWSVVDGDPSSGTNLRFGWDGSIDGLSASESDGLTRAIPSEYPPSPQESILAVRRHMSEHANDPLAGVVGQKLLDVLARWNELGQDGRRLIAGAANYFAASDDAVLDDLPGGLEDDLRVVQAVCASLDLLEIE